MYKRQSFELLRQILYPATPLATAAETPKIDHPIGPVTMPTVVANGVAGYKIWRNNSKDEG